MFFQPFDGYGEYVRRRGDFTSPSGRIGIEIDHMLQRRLAFLDSNHRLSVAAHRLDPDFRAGVEGPKHDIWKLAGSRRAAPDLDVGPRSNMTRPIAPGRAGRGRASRRNFPYTPQLIAKGHARAKAAVAKIRARGGEVVFVRPPSAPQLRVNEEAQVPKAKGWDHLLRNTRSVGVHADDLANAQNLTMPEWSHLNRACATVFTDAYVRAWQS